MATTTNYGWTTPNDTDLVKDGAAAIRTLGSSIDTTVFNNASAGIAKTIVDAKGDIIAATAADTVSRLAVGANGTILTADSAEATGIKWATPAAAGGMTLLSTTTFSGTTLTISGISGAYKNLVGIISGVTLPATRNFNLRISPNNLNNISDTATLSTTTWGQERNTFAWIQVWDQAATNTENVFSFTIEEYASTTRRKPYRSNGIFLNNTGSAREASIVQGGINTTSAITSLVFSTSQTSAGHAFQGGTLLLYGVN
jgi:hypothetical protein